MALRHRYAISESKNQKVGSRKGHGLCEKSADVSRICRISFPIFLMLAAKIAAAASVSVLFVGNSLTQVNDLPTTFKRFAAESSLHVEVDVHSITPGLTLRPSNFLMGRSTLRRRAPTLPPQSCFAPSSILRRSDPTTTALCQKLLRTLCNESLIQFRWARTKTTVMARYCPCHCQAVR